MIFPVSEFLEIEADLRIRDKLEAGGGEPLCVTVHLDEVKQLVAAVTDAAVWLAEEVVRNGNG
jgi:hypothetical protein